MNNSDEVAIRWTNFIAERPEFVSGALLLQQFAAGRISRLCDCGCHSYDIELNDKSQLPPLVVAGSDPMVFELQFASSPDGKPIEFLVLVDGEGYLSGLDVTYCGNAYPMPDNAQLIEPPHTIRGVLAHAA